MKTILTATVASLLLAGTASAATVSFSGSPTQSGASLTFGDVTVTGSDTVTNTYLNGLGIVNSVVDRGEWITLSFSEAVTDVMLTFMVAGGGSVGIPPGLRNLDVYGLGGSLLGSVSQSGAGAFDISAIVGGSPLKYFTLTAGPTTTFRISQVSYELAPAPIPLPASGLLLLAGLGGIAAMRRRQRAI